MPRRRARTALVALAWVVSLAVVAAACFWAGRVVTRAPVATTELPRQDLATQVTTDSVGRTLTYNVTIAQTRVPVATNLREGVVTAVHEQDSYTQGDTVYEVDSVPVRVIAGTTPFYRDLARDCEGPDVLELGQALADMGYLAVPGRTFGPATERAVKAWQKHLGLEPTGTVSRGELIAVPSLPQALFLDTTVLRAGAVLTGSEPIVSTASGDPTFSLDLSQDQAKAIPSDATITIPYEEHTWQAVITASGFKQDDSAGMNVYSLTLAAPDGGVVCGADCSVLPASEQLYVPASIEIVPEVSGPAVPVTALTTQPDGTTTVTLVEGGTTRDQAVTVVASVDGVAIVDGVTEGQTVRVYGSEAGAGESGAGDSAGSSGQAGEASDAEGTAGPGAPASGDDAAASSAPDAPQAPADPASETTP